jgi:hypothetical protein
LSPRTQRTCLCVLALVLSRRSRVSRSCQSNRGLP